VQAGSVVEAEEHTISPWLVQIEPTAVAKEHTVSPWLVNIEPSS
jgi:hypothetical protein